MSRSRPIIPLRRGELSVFVAQEWPDVARNRHVNAAQVTITIEADAERSWRLFCVVEPGKTYDSSSNRYAMAHLLDRLEARYIVVDRTEGRVVGWASAFSGGRHVAIAGLPDGHCERASWDARIDAERQERARAQGWPTMSKREKARAQRRAAR